jgi:hypothetical protein
VKDQKRQSDSLITTPVAPAMEEQNKENIGNMESPTTAPEGSLPLPVSGVRRLSVFEKIRLVMMLYWEDLRLRIGIILISLWLLNLVLVLHILANFRHIRERPHYIYYLTLP